MVDPQCDMPVTVCDRCGEGVFADEPAYLIDGFVICGSCFDDFALEYFSDCLATGAEIKEMLSYNESD